MSIIGQKYRIARGQYGLAVIEYTGLCTDDEVVDLESDVTRQFELIAIPNAAGAILKSLDGTQPVVVDVEPPALPNTTFLCVKIDAVVNPHTFKQTSGPWDGYFMNSFAVTYQQVGGLA